jgi:hypothetical protein
LRKSLIVEVEILNKKLKYKNDMRIIKKEAFKNMIECPSLNEMSLTKKDSTVSKRSRKDSKLYYSDGDDKGKGEVETQKYRNERTPSVNRLYSFDE